MQNPASPRRLETANSELRAARLWGLALMAGSLPEGHIPLNYGIFLKFLRPESRAPKVEAHKPQNSNVLSPKSLFQGLQIWSCVFFEWIYKTLLSPELLISLGPPELTLSYHNLLFCRLLL